ncbi:hypothetical protein EVAR_6579_1 [Eumeta japonica]|uniref:Uncharacterized protein n=1 Tax=Eumeta variegata TaxID=151549 RepID=A0A4C1SSU2_EUMVA|nr:hypothetical protein EVAR_6579_1 [Eumeta japonica]
MLRSDARHAFREAVRKERARRAKRAVRTYRDSGYRGCQYFGGYYRRTYSPTSSIFRPIVAKLREILKRLKRSSACEQVHGRKHIHLLSRAKKSTLAAFAGERVHKQRAAVTRSCSCLCPFNVALSGTDRPTRAYVRGRRRPVRESRGRSVICGGPLVVVLIVIWRAIVNALNANAADTSALRHASSSRVASLTAD